MEADLSALLPDTVVAFVEMIQTNARGTVGNHMKTKQNNRYDEKKMQRPRSSCEVS